MALTMEQKQDIVADVAAVAQRAHSALAASYGGLSVGALTGLRQRARKDGVYVQVVKNTLARRAMAGTGFEPMAPLLKGQLILGFSLDDPGAAARLFRDFAKENDKFEVKVVALGGQVYPASDIDRVANLPTKDQALATLLGVLQAPVAKLVRTINEVPGKLVRTIAAIRDAKEAA